MDNNHSNITKSKIVLWTCDRWCKLGLFEVPQLYVQLLNHIIYIYGIETGTNEHQKHDDLGSANGH